MSRGRPKLSQTEDLTKSLSWFCVFNNPAQHGYEGTPEDVCTRLRDEWCAGSETRSGAWVFCESADGLLHVHMVLEDLKQMRFSAIKKTYAVGMHFEPTKGSKKDVEEYINKQGKWEEKGEKILFRLTEGSIKGHQGRRETLDDIGDLIEKGLTPFQIIDIRPVFARYLSEIKVLYYRKRCLETPFMRPVKVIWHTGESGSGKSYSRYFLEQKYGEDSIYYLTAFGRSAFDGYNGEPILWIEDFKGEMQFGEFLRVLDVYKADIPARYANVKALWNEVHITSIYHPKGCYLKMVRQFEQGQDKVQQLLRRIDREGCIRYHWRSADGQYHYSDFSTSVSLEEMRLSSLKGEEWRIIQDEDDLQKVSDDCN